MTIAEYQEFWDDVIQDIPLEAIALEEAQLAQASQWSKRGLGKAQQWQIYRNGLALLGFEQWLIDRGIRESLHLSQGSLLNTVTANLLDAVTQVTIGSMQVALCLRSFEQKHPFPMLLHHHTPFRAHLYVWVDLWEETGHVAIASGLWHRDLVPAVPASNEWVVNLSASAPWLNSDQVLFALRQADQPQDLNNPSDSPVPSSTVLTKARLEAKLQRWTTLSLYSEVLDLQAGLQILRSPDLSQCFEQTLKQSLNPSWLSSINVGQWWSNVVDTVQADMGWQRLPMIAMRSPVSGNDAILGQLMQQGIQIPSHAQASYRDLVFAAQALRLYAVAWPHSNQGEACWSLLIALCNEPSVEISQPIQFEIRDADQSLAQEQLLPQAASACRYIQVTGGLDEQFWVTLTHLQQADMVMTLPPFVFIPVESS